MKNLDQLQIDTFPVSFGYQWGLLLSERYKGQILNLVTAENKSRGKN